MYLQLSDLLKLNGIDPKEVLLIRHALSDDWVRKCYEQGFIHEYTQIQGKDKKALSEYKYWMVFISTSKTYCKLYAMYKFKEKIPNNLYTPKDGYPFPQMYNEGSAIYSLEETDLFSEWKNRLVIDWGTSTQSWYQKAINKKPVVAITSDVIERFEGYEKSIFTFDELEEIVDDMTTGFGRYSEHIAALSNVYGVYLIVDTSDGKQYVGSAYGKDGILGRWKTYVETHHGGNKMLIELLNKHSERYKKFQFSVLQIISKNALPREVEAVEAVWKKKLGSRVCGLNAN